MTNHFVRALAINGTGDIFAGTASSGVFHSSDNGDSWNEINSGLIITRVRSFALNSTDGIFVGTDGGGVFRSLKSTTEVQEISTILPVSFALFQNYPNPFNPETEIRFQLPEASHVGLRIFNTLGQEIRTLVDSPYALGSHSISWEGKDHGGNLVASGVYLYQLQTGDFVQKNGRAANSVTAVPQS